MAVKRRYFDYNATTPLSDAARFALVESLDVFGNPSSVHQEGRAAKALLQKARRQVASRLKTDPEHVVFTSGASEAAMTLLSPFYKMGRADMMFSHLYIGATEHPCITSGGRFAPSNVTVVNIGYDGLIKQDELKDLLKKHDKSKGLPLVAIQAANGETGVIQPIRDIADIVAQEGGVLVVDLVQYIGKSSVDIDSFGGDFFIVAAHKIGGPKGIGAFIARGSTLMPSPFITAGGQERGFRGGTEALPLIAAFGAAMADEPSDNEILRIDQLRLKLENGLKQLANDLIVFGDNAPRLSNTTYFALGGAKAETIQIGMDLAGFAVSAGSACSSGKVKKSSVLSAMGVESGEGAIRVSLGPDTSETDIDDFLCAFEKMVHTHEKYKTTLEK